MTIKFLKGTETFDTELCMRDLNLLAHAQMIELSVGSECGGHGRCGRDRIRIEENDREKFNPPTTIEIAHLGAKNLENGLRLACQIFPNSDDLTATIKLP